MRRAALALTALAALALSGCGSVASPPATIGQDSSVNGYESDASVLRDKIEALRSDQCTTGDPSAQFPHCGKFVTELASTVGSVRTTSNDARMHAFADALDGGIRSYQQQRCDAANAPAQGCTAALRSIDDALTGISGLLTPASPGTSTTTAKPGS